MNKYKVLEDITIGDTTHSVDSEVELTEEVAAPFVEEGKLELVTDEEAEEEAA